MRNLHPTTAAAITAAVRAPLGGLEDGLTAAARIAEANGETLTKKDIDAHALVTRHALRLLKAK